VTSFFRDKGVGISTNNHTRLFDRYFRVENNKAKFVLGFGLGLSILPKLLKYTLVKVWAESKINQVPHFSLVCLFLHAKRTQNDKTSIRQMCYLTINS